MRVLITGTAGFIGSHLADFCKKNGEQVISWVQGGVYEYGKKYMNADLMDSVDARKILGRYIPDLILHCAGSADVNRSIEEPLLDLEKNYITTHNLLFAMKDLQMLESRFLLMSSAAVYGSPVSLPITEEQKCKPLSPYALHKKAAEEICLYAHENYGLDTKVLRIFSAYGPGLKKQLFWDMHQKAMKTGRLDLWGNGEESRDYIYIDDLVQAVMLVAKGAPNREILYNVANCEEIKIKKAAQVFAKEWGINEKKIFFTGKQREGNPINWKGDISKLLSLGYSRKITFEEGIKRYIEWVKV